MSGRPYRGRLDPHGTALESAYRADRDRVLARLIRILGDFDLAEDALQDALVTATSDWPAHGVPANPAGWLVTTARRKAIDRLRSAAASDRRARAWGELAVAWDIGDGMGPIPDDRLRLMFTCCHPALTHEAQVALTLRTLGGLSTDEVARAFLISEPALAQRIVRAKRKIRSAGIGYRVPSEEELPARLAAVLAVIYLVFNAGYLAPSGPELVKVDLCDEALRLAGLLADLLPGDPEPLSLAAMMYFQDARRGARLDAEGVPLTLDEQDRAGWERAKVAMGLELLERARGMGLRGPYGLKASISALHATAPRADVTDWRTIVRLYDALLQWEPTAVVRLNRAVAVAMADSPAAGLKLVDDPDLRAELTDYHLYEVTRADLLRRMGRSEEAAASYRMARRQTGNAAEHRFIDRRLETLGDVSGPGPAPEVRPEG
ncbi:MAG: RNA polymerase sigma factor [Acidimicrobiales bacterium]